MVKNGAENMLCWNHERNQSPKGVKIRYFVRYMFNLGANMVIRRSHVVCKLHRYPAIQCRFSAEFHVFVTFMIKNVRRKSIQVRNTHFGKTSLFNKQLSSKSTKKVKMIVQNQPKWRVNQGFSKFVKVGFTMLRCRKFHEKN